MKVIFLDIDGVLNSDGYYDSIEDKDVSEIEEMVDINTIKLLKLAVDKTGANVVLTSSWRYRQNAQILKACLRDFGIIPDLTPNLNNVRGKEIKKYLDEHKDIDDYVIVDDEDVYYDEELMKKLVKTKDRNIESFGDGLRQKHVDEIIERLGRKRNSSINFEDGKSIMKLKGETQELDR